jgi:lipoate-protein ligase A
MYRDNLQVLRRFTGGGTVIVDASTVFASLIFNVRILP